MRYIKNMPYFYATYKNIYEKIPSLHIMISLEGNEVTISLN